MYCKNKGPNNENKRIIDKIIKQETAIKAYYIFNLIGIASGFYAAYQVEKMWFGIIFVYFAISLWRYSKQHKTSFIIGNLQVAFLTALSIINLALYDLIPVGITIGNEPKIIFYIILFYAGFAFITTLIREIIKDLEDIEGDKNINAQTLAITYGIKKTKWIALAFTILTFFGIAYLQYFQYSFISSEFEYDDGQAVSLYPWGVNHNAILYTIFIQCLFVFLCLRIYNATHKKDFYFISQLCKVIMIVGILSMPLFTYLHLN